MNDQDFLRWIHNRLVEVHGENANYDYMQRLMVIAESVSSEPASCNCCDQSMEIIDLKAALRTCANASSGVLSQYNVESDGGRNG